MPRRRPVRFTQIDQTLFQNQLEHLDPLSMINGNNIEVNMDVFCDELYTCGKGSLIGKNDQNELPLPSTNDQRWQRIIESHDDKLLWQSINWKGEACNKQTARPSDEEFKCHLESLLCPNDAEQLSQNDFMTDVTIPVLDAPIDPNEVAEVIEKQVKPNKNAGPDGLSPGLFKLLPVEWIVTLTTLLNSVFVSGCYPAAWAYARLNMLFKKGCPLCCDNYRGISIINSICKIYDYILCNRLMKWYSPDREQAGAQPRRGCMEHIVTLRLIMNYCFRKKVKLFITYVDFSKAYDRVPRNKLLGCLRKLGYGLTMLLAILAMYQVTKNLLGMAVITATLSVYDRDPHMIYMMYI